MVKEKTNDVLLVELDSDLQQAHLPVHPRAAHPLLPGVERTEQLLELLQGQHICSLVPSLRNHVVQLFQLGLVCQLDVIPNDPPDTHEAKLYCDPQWWKLVVLCACCGCVGGGVHPVGYFLILKPLKILDRISSGFCRVGLSKIMMKIDCEF